MERIGIRELRQNASKYLDRVKNGESFEVTSRGVPVAMLTPAQKPSLYDRLVAEGRIIPGKGNLSEWLDANPPITIAAGNVGVRSASGTARGAPVAHYFDSSALVKLVLDERESNALRSYERQVTRIVSSELVRTEVARAVARVTESASRRVAEILQAVQLVPLSTSLLSEAGRLSPAALRSLGAIHLASALLIRPELEAFVAYDDRLLDAATALGMPVASPT